jgi:NAD+ synthase (glutamine-hydrolysing)
MRIRLALAQINTVVGDLDHNRRQIVRRLDTARELNADVVVFPELAITGYPPEDLLLKPDFVAAANASLHALLPATQGLTAVVGCLDASEDLFSGAAVLHDGELVGSYHKRYLPNYGVFDERRYFQSGRQQLLFRLGDDAEMGVSICEDIWYPGGPPSEQALRGGAELLINISASPYHIDKGDARERMLATRAADNTAFVGYCNLVGGQDELVFDGRSLICSPDGQILARGKEFEEDLVVADLDLGAVFRQRLFDPRRRDAPHDVAAFKRRAVAGFTPHTPKIDVEATRAEPHARVGAAYAALTLGTRDYVRKNGFERVVLGLSGGIDSSLTAVIAADALGPENVTGVAMPTRYSSSHSLEDARQLADNLGIDFLKIPIDDAFQSFLDTLAPLFEGREPDVTEENLQPRTRGTILMALSNKFGWLVLTTGNKSEISVGYVTLYGDTVGGFAVLKDVYKELVYELAHHRNAQAGFDVIPERVLEKPPSAELRPDQKDTDSLPPYETLDAILHAYIEERRSAADIVALGFEPATVGRVIRMVDRNEFKRRQSAPGVKITTRAFGRDWRPPITNHYDETETLSTD